MLRSMYTAVSGLRAHQFKMDVIGNNIANVNTVGFKKSQVAFQEVFSQTLRGASAPQGGRAGTNPQQVGLGVNVGSVRVVHEGSTPQRTDNPLDFYMSGDGFFMVSGDPNFNNRYYTRAGNFERDEYGTLHLGGLKVLGYQVDEDGRITDQIGDIKIDKSTTVPPSTTKNMALGGNLDSRTEVGGEHITDTVIYDSLGNPYNVKYKITKTAEGQDGSTWKASIVEIDGATVPSNAEYDIEFDKEGNLKSPTTPQALIITKDGVEFGDAGGSISIDFSGLTQYGNDTTAKAEKKDGNTSGSLDSFSISPTGEVVGTFTNGEQAILAQIAVAKFDNPEGLLKQGSNLFSYTRNSGEPQVGKAGGSGYGEIIGGALEMSNVDLSYEFTEMITTQRGFQANSRVITTSDEILQELVNLKR
ncbi:flagellar hook protein FlgE [Gottschalkia acidurici 9a]|uniref:Flagellar hook protein FlgE n=1 Tax=Gottschalkia acidurici (strain ATCC 7906 / DSM 604 / BCRC 14475 / CIP 104303 / KCTC 5404 / NCIMB 10678 / 9a) TaxID=1128398 RepID=K0AXR1_GOTA9|nr:flagellar hook protein FlgE [Gottschalkia acidurici]AFS78603.1 flagellar hook protein FlgE [Gottschalkia acidurici 9a]